MRLPEDSVLNGKSLAESRLGISLGLNVVGILREGQMRLAPDPHFTLQSGDRLLVGGTSSQLDEVRGHEYLQFETDSLAVERLVSSEIEVVEVEILPGSSLIGKSLRDLDFRSKVGCIVLAIRRAGIPHRTGLEVVQLAEPAMSCWSRAPARASNRLRARQNHLDVSSRFADRHLRSGEAADDPAGAGEIVDWPARAWRRVTWVPSSISANHGDHCGAKRPG